MTVADIIEELKKSQGFVMFVSFAAKNVETGAVELQHRYIRQQFIPEDLDKSFENLGAMIAKDLSDSGTTLIRSAEKIANTKLPAPPIDTEHTAG